MKYETLSEAKSGSYSSGTTVVFTFTFVNNIDHIEFIYFKNAGSSSTNTLRLTSFSISGNILTVTLTSDTTSGQTDYPFVIATVASY